MQWRKKHFENKQCQISIQHCHIHNTGCQILSWLCCEVNRVLQPFHSGSKQYKERLKGLCISPSQTEDEPLPCNAEQSLESRTTRCCKSRHRRGTSRLYSQFLQMSNPRYSTRPKMESKVNSRSDTAKLRMKTLVMDWGSRRAQGWPERGCYRCSWTQPLAVKKIGITWIRFLPLLFATQLICIVCDIVICCILISHVVRQLQTTRSGLFQFSSLFPTNVFCVEYTPT